MLGERAINQIDTADQDSRLNPCLRGKNHVTDRAADAFGFLDDSSFLQLVDSVAAWVESIAPLDTYTYDNLERDKIVSPATMRELQLDELEEGLEFILLTDEGHQVAPNNPSPAVIPAPTNSMEHDNSLLNTMGV